MSYSVVNSSATCFLNSLTGFNGPRGDTGPAGDPGLAPYYDIVPGETGVVSTGFLSTTGTYVLSFVTPYPITNLGKTIKFFVNFDASNITSADILVLSPTSGLTIGIVIATANTLQIGFVGSPTVPSGTKVLLFVYP